MLQGSFCDIDAEVFLLGQTNNDPSDSIVTNVASKLLPDYANSNKKFGIDSDEIWWINNATLT